jgi:hypothetical protein
MLEEAADDRLDVDVLAEARHAGPQAADAATTRSIGRPRARLVELVDDAGSTSEFILAQMPDGLPALALAISHRSADELCSHLRRRDDQLLEFRGSR